MLPPVGFDPVPQLLQLDQVLFGRPPEHLPAVSAALQEQNPGQYTGHYFS